MKQTKIKVNIKSIKKSKRKMAEENEWVRQPENANGGKGRAVCAS